MFGHDQPISLAGSLWWRIRKILAAKRQNAQSTQPLAPGALVTSAGKLYKPQNFGTAGILRKTAVH